MILILRMTEIIRDYKNFQVDGDEDEPEVGEGGLIGPVVAGGGLAAVLHAVEDVFDHVPPSRETPTDREPLFRRSGRVPADLWNLLRHGFVPSSPIAVCFVWRQKIVHRTRAMPLSQAQTKVRKIPGVGGCGRFLGDNHAAIPWL